LNYLDELGFLLSLKECLLPMLQLANMHLKILEAQINLCAECWLKVVTAPTRRREREIWNTFWKTGLIVVIMQVATVQFQRLQFW